MKIGITYDIKEQYGFETLDLNFTDFLNVDEVSFLKDTLEKCGHTVVLLGNSSQLIQRLNLGEKVDLVFNASWGYRGRNREGLIAAILEGYGIPYTGTDAFGCMLCLDKIQTKLVAKYLNVPTPDFFLITADTVSKYYDNPALSFPLVLKPSCEGTGMGVTLVSNIDEYHQAIDHLLNVYTNEPILCETYIEGEEVTVPMLEGANGLYAVGVLSIRDKNGKSLKLYDASIKTSHSYIKKLSSMPDEINRQLEYYSCKIYSFIKGEGYGRADFRVSNDGIPYFLEIAPLPLLAPHSSFNMCTSQKNLSHEAVLEQIVDAACRKYGLQQR